MGPYRLVRLLGAGTGGRVFEVVHEKLGRPAALKLLEPAQAARPAARARFLAEALSVNRIDHPHIVEVTDVVEEDGHAALVMELLEGQSLGAALAAESPLPPERFLPILEQICAALAAAHAAGFVHRDLKPENVFLCVRPDEVDFVKLLDFGVATTFTPPSISPPESTSRVSSSGLRGPLVGTPAYASPEQASGEAVDHRADIYAVGVMLYELVCGRLPFEGWTAGQFLIQHLSAPVPRLPADMQATPLGQALDGVVQRCMAKRAAERFSSAAELGSTFAALAREDFAEARASLARLPAPPLSGRAYGLAGLALAAILALGWLWFGRAGVGGSAAPARVVAAPAPRAPTAAPFVTITFTSEPPGAEVRRAKVKNGKPGELLGVTPFSRAFAREGGEGQNQNVQHVEFRRAGYSRVKVTVPTAASHAVGVTLARVRKASRWFGSEKTLDPFRHLRLFHR